MRKKRSIVLSLLLSLLSLPSLADVSNKPVRIASTDLCLDQYLLLLAEPQHIVSTTYLSADPEYSAMAYKVGSVTLNHSLAEEIIPLKPDLVFTTPFTPGNANRLLKQQGLSVIELSLPNTIDDMILLVQKMSAVIHEVEKGQSIANQLHHRVEKLKNNQQIRGTALAYAPNGYTGGANTLQNEGIQLAGWKNLATELGMKGYGTLSLETLIRHPPDLLILDGAATETESRAQQLFKHPALKEIQKRQSISLPAHTWLCATPALIDAIERLADLPERNQ